MRRDAAVVAGLTLSLCVQPAGVVEWEVKNHCKRLASGTKAASEIAGLRVKATGAASGWFFESCSMRLDTVEFEDPSGTGPKPKGNRLLCGVPADAPEGLYKYDVQGPGDREPSTRTSKSGTDTRRHGLHQPPRRGMGAGT